ncbi:MAG: hypothetical protein AAFQ43_10865 [Bacteroidota bacterium]
MRRLLILPLAIAFAACGSTPEPTNRDRLPRAGETPPDTSEAPVPDGYFTSEADYERQRSAALADLDAAIGTPRATSVGQCRIVPVGAKPCGGPLEYRLYAASGPEELTILRLAGVVGALDAEANEQFEYVSTCDLTPEPTPRLVQGICIAQ